MSKIIIVKDRACNEIALEFYHDGSLNITQRSINTNSIQSLLLTEKQMRNLRDLLTIKIQSMEKANG